MENPHYDPSAPSHFNSNQNDQQPPLGPGGTQHMLGPSGTQHMLGPGATGGAPNTSLIMIGAILALIQGLGTLNGFLKTVSSTILQADLSQDNRYANLLSQITLQTPKAGGGSATKAHNQSISVANQRKMMYQQVLQARLKTHQNQEQIDIQSASTTTSNMQQLASMLSSMIDLLGQVFSSVNTVNR